MTHLALQHYDIIKDSGGLLRSGNGDCGLAMAVRVEPACNAMQGSCCTTDLVQNRPGICNDIVGAILSPHSHQPVRTMGYV